MKGMWYGSETERLKEDVIYEKDKYYTKEAKPYKVKKVYFTLLAEDEDGNEREFKEHEITTESKETIIMHLRHFGHDVVEYPNHIVLNPDTDNQAIDVLHFTNNILFNEGAEGTVVYALKEATRIHDELIRFREWVKDEEDFEKGIGIYADDDDD
jgi:hypothetical protein